MHCKVQVRFLGGPSVVRRSAYPTTARGVLTDFSNTNARVPYRPLRIAWLQRQPGLAIWETHYAGDAWQREHSPCWDATGTAEVPRLLDDAA